MHYIALIYYDPAVSPIAGTAEHQALLQEYFAMNDTLKADGVYVGSQALKGVETATSLRVRGGKVETMDGPFAETKERLGGFYIFDVPDLDAALRYAAMIPSSIYGTIEVRPVMNYQT